LIGEVSELIICPHKRLTPLNYIGKTKYRIENIQNSGKLYFLFNKKYPVQGIFIRGAVINFGEGD
jgi:hypothetical protein